MCIVLDGGVVSGHVSQELSKIVWIFRRRDGKATCEVMDLESLERELEVPCKYYFEGTKRLVTKLENLLEYPSNGSCVHIDDDCVTCGIGHVIMNITYLILIEYKRQKHMSLNTDLMYHQG